MALSTLVEGAVTRRVIVEWDGEGERPSPQAFVGAARRAAGEPVRRTSTSYRVRPGYDAAHEVWVFKIVKRLDDQTIPSRIVTHVYEDHTAPNAEHFPWFFTVDAYPDAEGGLAGEPVVIDYGAVATRAQADAAVRWALAHRDQCDNPDYR